jgi:putative flippase GtrA
MRIIVKATVISGWTGIVSTAIAIACQDKPIYLLAQLISITSGFLWSLLLNKKLTWDLILSLVLSAAATVLQSEWVLYSSALARSISYQLILARLIRSGEVQ